MDPSFWFLSPGADTQFQMEVVQNTRAGKILRFSTETETVRDRPMVTVER